MNVPYERIVAYLAGPLSIAAGYLSTQLMAHVSLFGSLGIGQSDVAKAIVSLGTFALGAGLTYAGHHKWLTNLAKFWETSQAAAAPFIPESAVTPDLEESEAKATKPRQPAQKPAAES